MCVQEKELFLTSWDCDLCEGSSLRVLWQVQLWGSERVDQLLNVGCLWGEDLTLGQAEGQFQGMNSSVNYKHVTFSTAERSTSVLKWNLHRKIQHLQNSTHCPFWIHLLHITKSYVWDNSSKIQVALFLGKLRKGRLARRIHWGSFTCVRSWCLSWHQSSPSIILDHLQYKFLSP